VSFIPLLDYRWHEMSAKKESMAAIAIIYDAFT